MPRKMVETPIRKRQRLRTSRTGLSRPSGLPPQAPGLPEGCTNARSALRAACGGQKPDQAANHVEETPTVKALVGDLRFRQLRTVGSCALREFASPDTE